jgi:hypothetical protein
MATENLIKGISGFPSGKVHLRLPILMFSLLLIFAQSSFGQVGPYFYGSPNPATSMPDPPVPAASYYTIGISEGLPQYLDPVSDQINPTTNPQFLTQLIQALPERVDRSNNLGLGGAADMSIIDDSSDVYLVFVTEGAAARNALGYFLYKGDISPNDLNQPNPLVPGKTYLESRRIVFPNASLEGPSPFLSGSGGGKLKSGNRVKLIGDQPDGKFSKDVRVSFFIISNGWNGNQVGNGSSILYSNPELNPRKKRQAALLDFTATEGRTIITFEDTRRTPDAGSDNDFNDVVFYISQKVEGGQTVYYPDCSGKFVLTKAEYDLLPKDENGKLICTITPPPVNNLSLTAVCSDDPTNQLAWRVSNPNAETRPFTWIITDGVSNLVKLASPVVLDALPGDNIIYTNPVSGVNAMTILVEGTKQPNGSNVVSNTTPCITTPPVPPLTCCAVFASEVVSYKPGTTRLGSRLPTNRTDASQALGASGPASSFVALGLKGTSPSNEASIVLKFPKPVRGFVNVFETTFGPALANFVETADVYGSLDGSIFYKIGTANNQEKNSVDIHRTTFELKDEYAQIQYLKIIDVTPAAIMPDNGDGFDLEAVCASDFALETIVFDPNAQPGSVKVDKEQIKAAQGRQKDGKAVWSSNPHKNTSPTCVLAGLCDPEGIDRSNVNSILARDDAFYSFGIGGSLEIEFTEPITGSLILFERTGDPKPVDATGSINYIEKVAIYVKTADCNEWGDPIGYADNQGPQFGVPNGSFDHQIYKSVISLGGRTIKYVKLVDVTPSFSTSADGYDLDFIASTSNGSSLSGDLTGNYLSGPDDASSSGMVVTAFPNPTTGNLTLDFGYQESGFISTVPTIVTVSDLVGNVILRQDREANSTEPLTLDLSNQRNGLYFISIRTGDTVINKKIYIQQ